MTPEENSSDFELTHDDVIKWEHLCGELTGLRWIPRTKQGRIQDLKSELAQMDFENRGGGGGGVLFFINIAIFFQGKPWCSVPK